MLVVEEVVLVVEEEEMVWEYRLLNHSFYFVVDHLKMNTLFPHLKPAPIHCRFVIEYQLPLHIQYQCKLPMVPKNQNNLLLV